MKHRLEGPKEYLVEVIDSVQGTLFVHQKYIAN